MTPIEPNILDETLLHLSGVVGKLDGRLDGIEAALSRVEGDMRELSRVMAPQRILRVSLTAGGGGGALLAGIAWFARWLAG